MLVFVVDDDPDLREVLRVVLEGHGFEVRTFGGGAAVLLAMAEREPDALVLDLDMPEVSGVDVLQVLAEQSSEIPVVVLSANEEFGAVGFTPRLHRYLLKPVDPVGLVESLKWLHPSRRTPQLSDEDRVRLGLA